MFMTLKDKVLVLGHVLARAFLVPIISMIKLRGMRSYQTFTLTGIRTALNTDSESALTIYKQSITQFVSLAAEFYFFCRYSQAHLQRHLDAIELSGIENITCALASSRPILLVTIYMGNFPLSFLKLISSVDIERQVYIFKVNPKSANEERLFSLYHRASQYVHPLRLGEHGGKKAFFELRKGNIVAMMIDAEVRVTSREKVAFLNQSCNMQSGPATLAYLSKATILPVVNYTNGHGQQVVRIEKPIASQKLLTDSSHKEAIARITQELASTMENWIHMAPEQVQRWPSIAQIMAQNAPTDL